VRRSGVLDVDAAKEQLVRLRVEDRVATADAGVVVLLGKEARGTQDDHRQSATPGAELAQVLGGELGDAIDVPGAALQLLRHPRGRCILGRSRRQTEGAGRARVHEGAHTGCQRALEQHLGTGDVRVDERLGLVGSEVRFVQRRGVDDGVDATRDLGDELTVTDRSHPVGER